MMESKDCKVVKLDGQHYGYCVGMYEYRMGLVMFRIEVRDITVAKVMRRSLARIQRDLASYISDGGWILPDAVAPYWLAAQPQRGPHEYRVLVELADLARMHMLWHLREEEAARTHAAIVNTHAAIQCAHAWRSQALRLEQQLRDAGPDDEAAVEAQIEQACQELERQGKVIGIPQANGETLWCLPKNVKQGSA